MLEKENRSLLRELEELRQKHVQAASADHGPPATRPVLAEISANSKTGPLSSRSSAFGPDEKPNWEEKYSKLSRQFAALTERHQSTQITARKVRDSGNGWKKYAASLEGKLKSLEKKLQRYEGTSDQTPAPSTTRKPAPVGTVNTEPLSGRTAIGSGFMSDLESDTSSGIHEDATTESTGHGRASSTLATTRPEREVDEETDDEAEGAYMLPPIPPNRAAGPVVSIKQEPSSDSPVIVSERSLRKRKHADEDFETPGPSRKIKSEQSTSSDPIITAEVATFCPHESIDLDEDQHGMPTPRKQRLREDCALTPRDDKVPLELLHTGTRPGDNVVHTITPTLGITPSRPAATELSTHKSVRTHRGSRLSTRPEWNLGSAIADVAEDTFEDFHSPRPERSGVMSTHLTPTRGRLHSLLHQGSPKANDSVLRPTRPARDSRMSHLDREYIEELEPPQGPRQRRNILTKASPAVKSSTSTLTPRHPQDKSSVAKPSRLRDRPLTDLRAEDFKVNPKSNNGYKHAFDEVVRSKGERAELTGCIDPQCCGKKFRAMAESELSAGGPGILSRVADTKMLEDYMGGEAHRLLDMTREELRETWLKAKTQDLADRYGRHRHRFTRRPSPPGYWNPDFPSTQEIEMRKEEAAKIERGLVEERWREAMRGGRWVFRDE